MNAAKAGRRRDRVLNGGHFDITVVGNGVGAGSLCNAGGRRLLLVRRNSVGLGMGGTLATNTSRRLLFILVAVHGGGWGQLEEQ